MIKLGIRLFVLILLNSCANPEQPVNVDESVQNNRDVQKSEPRKSKDCWSINAYKDLGNQLMDTIMIDGWLTDPIDDFTNFEEAGNGFVRKGREIYKKANTLVSCENVAVVVEFYQDLTSKIDLASFKAYDDRYFTSKGQVYYWWVNSSGHLVLPIDQADPKTFKPFKNICGGMDKKSIYYGCPNLGVHQLNIPRSSNFEFVPKADNFWNAPKHYVTIDGLIYDIKYSIDKGYYCELEKGISLEDIMGKG